MPPSKVLFCLLLSFLLVVKNVESQNTAFALDTFTPNSPLLTYERDAFVPPGSSYIRMTAVNSSGWPLQLRVGRVLYNAPVNLWTVGRQASFETTITLQMTPVGNFNSQTMGQGITFFIVPLNSLMPTGGHSNGLGIYNTVAPGTPIFAVEFDLSNDGILNPRFQHIGINPNTRRSQVVTSAALYGNRVTARITYDVPTKKINVVASYGSTTTTLSFYFNLKTLFSQQVQIGLSASTGAQRLALLDVHTWHFSSAMGPDFIGANSTDDNKPYVM